MRNVLFYWFHQKLMFRHGSKHLHVWQIRLIQFPVKDGRDAVNEGSNGWKGVYFPPKAVIFPLKIIWSKYISFFVPWLPWLEESYIKESGNYQSYEFFRMGKCQKRIDQRFNNKILRNIRNNSILAQNTNEIKFAWYRKNVVIELKLGTKKTTLFPGNPKTIQLG